jgi:Carboxypeptidase regulatory-like domain
MHLETRTSAVFLSVLLLFAGILSAGAQNVNSSIQGTVADKSGAMVPDASVKLTNTRTGVLLKTRSDRSGAYSFPAVQPGVYSLEVTKQGFATYDITEFSLVVGQRASENVTLSVASSAQTVTVEANGLANLLETQSNDLGTVIGPESVAQLPLNGRNFLQLGLLSGTALPNSGPSNNTVSQTGHPSLSINIAGNEPDYTMYLVNGIETVGSRANNTSLNLSVSAIDQFEVHYGFFMPDLGASPGIVDVVTKSGTNRFHGEAYEYVRTDQMEARDYFSTTAPGPYHQNQFGASAGGPILHNKLFFFGNYEGYRQNQHAFSGAYVPTQDMFNGDFSALSTPIYDPATYNSTTGTRQQFPGNIIPSGRINPVSKALLAYFLPGAAITSNSNNFGGNPQTTLNTNQVTGRIDFSANEANQFFAQGSWLNSPATGAGLFPAQATTYPLDTEFVALGWTWTLSPTKVNSFSVGVVRDSVYDQGQSIAGIQNKLGITGTADADGVPSINLNGYSGFGISTGLLGDRDNSYQIHDSFNWLRGNHQLKMGVSFNYVRSVQSSANLNARGIFTFNPQFTAQTKSAGGGKISLVAKTGDAFADFLLGDPANAHSQGMPPTHVKWTTVEPYFQDTWKVTRSLSANLALAWFGSTPPNPTDQLNRNLIHGFDWNTGYVTFAALGTANPQVYNMTLNSFAPRIGLSWQPPFAKNTVVRAGWGMYYPTPMHFGIQYSVVSQIITVNNQVSNAANQPFPTYSFGNNVLPPVTVGQITAAQVPTITGSVLYEDANSRMPSVPQWNFDVQHTFGKSYLLDVSYIGNEGHHLAKLFNPLDCSVPGTQYCDTSTEPFYPRLTFMQDMSTLGFSNYNSLLVKFNRQFSHGLSILTNYTFSKALSAANASNNGGLSQSKSCLRCDKGLAPSNVPQSLVISAVWQLPVGRGKQFGTSMNRVLDGVIGGWSVNAITAMQKGNPFTVTAPNHVAWPADQIRADRYCNGRNELSNKNLRTNGMYWLNTGTVASVNSPCFVDPFTDPHNTSGNSWYFGTSGFDILTGPGINNWDLGVHKEFPIRELVKFSIRGEFFNAWNHAQFANPNSNVNAAKFGTVSATQHAPRQVQIGATLSF